MAWFWEIRGSKTYLIWRAVVIQWWFGYGRLKQMFNKVGIDEWLKDFSSAMLILAQNQICHGNALDATVEWRALQLRFEACCSFQKVCKWWHQAQDTSSMKVFSKSSQWRKWKFLREMAFDLFSEVVARVFRVQMMNIYSVYCWLIMVNEVVIEINLNEVFWTFY